MLTHCSASTLFLYIPQNAALSNDEVLRTPSDRLP